MGEEFFICPEGAPERVDKVLSKAFPQKSRALIQRAIEKNRIRSEGWQALGGEKQSLFRRRINYRP